MLWSGVSLAAREEFYADREYSRLLEAGSRSTKAEKVRARADRHEFFGSVDEISADHNLTPAEVHAALTYYFDHREEINTAMRESEAFVESLRRQTPSKLREG